MIDLTDLPGVDVGDEVEIFGPHNPVEVMAAQAGTIPYELTCAVSKRVPRCICKTGRSPSGSCCCGSDARRRLPPHRMKRGGKPGINPRAAWENESDPFFSGYFFRRSVNVCGYECQARRNLLCRPEPGGRQRGGGVRPVLIVQNDTGNRHSPTVIAAAITSQMGRPSCPPHIEVAAQCCGLPKDSVILLEQIRTLDKRRLRERMGRVDGAVMERVDDAIAVSFGLPRSRLV